MMSLRDTQAVFFNAISEPDNDSQDRAAELIKSTGQLSPQQRLDIYRNTGLASKVKALQQIYPVCESILGERLFKKLARDYANNNPSLSNDLNIYGEQFPTFIEGAVNTYNELNVFTYLDDLCRLEWLWHKVYYQQDDSGFDFEAFAQYSHRADEISLNLSHSLEILASHYPIHYIWQQHQGKQLESSVKGLDEVEYLCIYRQDFVPKIEKISASCFALLNACQQGLTLDNIASDENLLATLEVLPEMISKGWICGFTHHYKGGGAACLATICYINFIVMVIR